MVENKDEPDELPENESQSSIEAAESNPEGSPQAEKEEEAAQANEHPSKGWWWKRPTVRQILEQEAKSGIEGWDKSDKKANEVSRLPDDESIHLGGVVLAEAFTPSTVSALYESIGRSPFSQEYKVQEIVDFIERSRSGAQVGGSYLFGLVRPPGRLIMMNGFSDPSLPEGVDAVWLTLHCPTPSLTILIATFSLEEDAGDLSCLLRKDYKTRFNPEIKIPGRLGKLRAKIPWSRPIQYGIGGTISLVEIQKREAYEQVASQIEEGCREWLSRNFGGRFSREPMEHRPSARLLLTKNQAPYKDHRRYLSPLGMDYPFSWRSQGAACWAIRYNDFILDKKRRFALVAAARRSDIAKSAIGYVDRPKSIWHATQGFHKYEFQMVSRWAMFALIALYEDRLGRLRDQAGQQQWRTVGIARELDRFLLGDGLDASAIASDLGNFSRDPQGFPHDFSEYVADQDPFPGEPTEEAEEPAKLVDFWRERLEKQCTRLLEDMETTTGNIRASAELKQSIANTKMQRLVIGLAFIAAIVAVVSLYVTASS
ncbi:hypothetical protein [Nocardiopsis sp. LOL_012]|uniref:hypothetical protein n=1 Tax=Nocardiopsis sp. LOL_012 TaxID=3345409 RepID=UPI003A87DEB0